jgi:hypothetical protein
MTNSSISKHWHYCLQEDELNIEQFSGTLDIKSLQKLKEQESQDPNFDVNLPLLSDIRSASPQFKLEEIKKYEVYASDFNIVGERKLAVLTNTPMQVAIASLFKSHTQKLAQEIEIFSTLEAALHWLDRSDSIQKVESLFSSKLR